MIGRLKSKVFWSILLTAAGVLLVLIVALNVLELAQTASTRDSVLGSAMTMFREENGSGQKKEGRRGEGKSKAEMMRFVSEDELGLFTLDSDGAVATLSGFAEQLDEETVSAVAAAALSDPDGQGRTDGWYYRAVQNRTGYAVAILKVSSLRRENVETALLSLAAFAVACCLFALIARMLSRSIVRPVEENMQMQKRFVSDAGHELKTPLTVIDANASVLEQSIGENKWLGYIKEQTGRMAGLVNELLQLSSLEETKETGASEPRCEFDAAEAVMSAALPFESVAFERGVTLETDVPDVLEVCGVRKDLEQLAAILIDNAVKHSPDGGTVKVSAGRASERHGLKDREVLELRVSNAGEEIPAEALPHLFDRFYRVDESRTHKDNSYGLGLAIAKGLAEKNGGAITVTSENGNTEFTLSLPAE